MNKFKKDRMAGLREKKKRQREKRIFSTAIVLFNKKGFENTTMKEIAGKAELGVGTLYNYFSSKNDLLITISLKLIEEKIEKSKNFFKEIIESDYEPKKIIEKVAKYFIEFLFVFNKQLWGKMLSAFFSSSRLLDSGVSMDMKVIALIEEILKSLKANKQISAETNIQAAAFAVYSMVMFQFMAFIFMKDMKKQDLYKAVESQINLLFKGLKP